MTAAEIPEHYQGYQRAKANWEAIFEAGEAGLHKGLTPEQEARIYEQSLRYSRELEDHYLWLEKNAPALAKTLLMTS